MNTSLIKYAKTQGKYFGFQLLRAKKYGLNELSYDWKGCSRIYTNYLIDYDETNIIEFKIDRYNSLNEKYSVYDHYILY